MKTEIILRNLGSYLPANTNYSGQANAFLTNGFASAAGNVYFNAVRLGEGIVIKEDVGQGYARTFLNGLRIYSLKERKLLADRTYHCNFYSKDGVKAEIRNMLFKLLEDAAEYSGLNFDRCSAKTAIYRMVDGMFNRDQQQMLREQYRKRLGN